MTRVFIDILNYMDKVPNLNELLPKELAHTTELKEKGILTHLFIKKDNTGAILVMNVDNFDKAKEIIATMPMFSYFEKVDYSYIEEEY